MCAWPCSRGEAVAKRSSQQDEGGMSLYESFYPDRAEAGPAPVR